MPKTGNYTGKDNAESRERSTLLGTPQSHVDFVGRGGVKIQAVFAAYAANIELYLALRRSAECRMQGLIDN